MYLAFQALGTVFQFSEGQVEEKRRKGGRNGKNERREGPSQLAAGCIKFKQTDTKNEANSFNS